MTDDRHSELDDVAPRPKLTKDQEARQAAENGLRQFDLLVSLIRQGIDAYQQGTFELRPSMLMDLDAVAVDRMVDGPGHYRRGSIKIGGARHTPPDARDIQRLVEDMCKYVNVNWHRSAVHLAAYVMWRLNWIHPFEDGNGRTSRAASYLVMCVRLGSLLPGTKTVPELIANDKKPYYDALEAADRADKDGKIDVSAMEILLQSLLLVQVQGAANDTVARGSQPARSVRQTQPGSKLESSDGWFQKHQGVWIGAAATIAAAIVTALIAKC